MYFTTFADTEFTIIALRETVSFEGVTGTAYWQWKATYFLDQSLVQENRIFLPSDCIQTPHLLFLN